MKLDQFGRRLCLRVQGVPFAENESLDDDVDKVKSLITEYGCEIPDVANGRAHWIGTDYLKIKLKMFPVNC